MERKASCGCGNLSITVEGEPVLVAVCNCLDCQSRTGSVFGVSGFFSEEQVIEKAGTANSYSKSGDSDPDAGSQFCPKCGTTVYWYPAFLENHVGVAVGCFSDPNFPEPQVTGWNRSKHKWVAFPDGWASSNTQEF
jgi:hypothetical protein